MAISAQASFYASDVDHFKFFNMNKVEKKTYDFISNLEETELIKNDYI